ncbi:MmcQ/YjbR family DNA-binding protein [Cohaesibacter celericrescens]|uniref:MmcQ/YjbR family DNA-binding protein n=1 Tax=Cohaesibacter celericrescens TaxID=2067669 RepID=UPI00356AD50D
MTREQFDSYCGGMKATTNVIQWGNASVWKIGGKIFAICSNWGDGKEGPEDQLEGRSENQSKNASIGGEAEVHSPRISFKCSDLAYELLPEQHGIIPAPYLARAKWVQINNPNAMSEQDLKLHLDAAYEIIAKKLTKKVRAELGVKI